MSDLAQGTEPGAAPLEREDLPSKVNRLAAVLSADHFPAGDRAALKRHVPGHPPPLAFYRLWLRHLGDELPNPAQTSGWAVVTWGLALSGPHAHRVGRRLGLALAESRFSESRLERLLSASDDLTRERLFTSLVRYLSSKGDSFDWVDAARLLLNRDPERREATVRRIATDYYRHQPHTDKE